MPTQAKGRPRAARLPARPRGLVEWVGGRLLPPFFVTGGEPYRPELVVWLELPAGIVVGHHLEDPKAPLAFGATLTAAMERPMVGPPRRPARVRVATVQLADEVRRVLGPVAEVVVGPTPEVDAVLGAMEQMAPAEDKIPDSYLEEGRVEVETVADLFRSAEMVYRIAPWKTLAEEQLIRVDIPRLGVHGGCLSVIGGAGESFGLVLFPSLAAFEAFAATAESAGDGMPRDFGTTVRALDFVRKADLPAEMRREISEHGWPVAGARAYPVVVHRDRDGLPRPLTDVDVKIMSACATSFGPFFLKNKSSLERDDGEPLSESYSDEHDLTVRFTYPYEAFEMFEVDEVPRAPRKAEPQVPRNAPCPCGSGKKYKKCHLAEDEAKGQGPTQEQGTPAVHQIDERVVDQMQRYAGRRFGPTWTRVLDVFDDVEEEIQLASPWSVYCAKVDGRAIVDWYLGEKGKYLPPDERGWLEAQRRSWLTIWEITGVEPGRGLQALDLLTGEARSISEVKGSRVLVKRDAVLGRVVDYDGISVFCGLHPRLLPPLESAEVVQEVRARLRRKSAPPPERLRDEAIGRFMIERWQDAVLNMDYRSHVPPQVANTDGEKLSLTTDVFTFQVERRSEVQERLARLDDVESPDGDDPRYVFLRGGRPAKGGGRTVVGTAAVDGAELRVESNSTERADRLRARLEEACGDLITHATRRQMNPIAPRLVEDKPRGATSEAATAPAELEAVRAFKARHYEDWADHPLPALDGKTPREAIRTAKGRAAVDVLLKDFEHHESRQPSEARFDFRGLRRNLGLPT